MVRCGERSDLVIQSALGRRRAWGTPSTVGKGHVLSVDPASSLAVMDACIFFKARSIAAHDNAVSGFAARPA